MNLLSFASSLSSSSSFSTKSNTTNNQNDSLLLTVANKNNNNKYLNEQEKQTVWILRDDFKKQIINKTNTNQKLSSVLLTLPTKSTTTLKNIPNSYITDQHYCPSNLQGKQRNEKKIIF